MMTKEETKKAIKFDNFSLRRRRFEMRLCVPLNIDAIKKQLMRQKLIEFSSLAVKSDSSVLNNALNHQGLDGSLSSG